MNGQTLNFCLMIVICWLSRSGISFVALFVGTLFGGNINLEEYPLVQLAQAIFPVTACDGQNVKFGNRVSLFHQQNDQDEIIPTPSEIFSYCTADIV